MRIPDRIIWTLIRRRTLARALPGFWASPISYCDRATVFAGYHSIKKRTEIYDSVIGSFTYFAENVRVKKCTIGPLCSIGPDVVLGDLPRHPANLISTHPLFYSTNKVSGIVFAGAASFDEYLQTTVGADVFIGARALVMPGVRLGHGCMVGAGSIVTKDVPPFAIVVGAPARVIKFRFSEEVIGRLLAIEWWTWGPEKLRLWQKLWASRGPVDIDALQGALDEVKASGL